jgi:hypothetical protein
MPYSYAVSVLLSAFLLFQIQPMIGKYILPWFGGTPGVWSTILLFFQALLTGGYAYAYWLLGRLRNRWQGIVHLSALAVSLGLLVVTALTWNSPITPDASWRPPSSASPIWSIVKILAVSVGVPYFLLSTNSTLMQSWFGQEDQKKIPYRLYALSNAGSLLALISYPILFEPILTLRTQAYLWSGGYVVFAFIAAYLALQTYRRLQKDDGQESTAKQPDESKRPSIGVHVLWVGLAAIASALLISVTNQITQEVAVVPFLWVLPLTVYLLSFILTFSSERWYSRRLFVIAFFVISFISVWMLVKWPPFSITTQVAIYILLLFVCCMICNGELYKQRPHPRFLPSFYLMIAVGGAAGGLFVNLVAPYLFTSGFWELQWAVVACGLTLAVIMQMEPERVLKRRKQRKSRRKGKQRRQRSLKLKPAVIASGVGLLLLSIAVISISRALSADILLSTRNFYGVLRVWEINTSQPALLATQLAHGKTVHGFQFEADQIRHLPTTYYSESSGVGLAIVNQPANSENMRIGALGLGIGIIATYAEQGDVYRFYEINPDVIRIAEGQGDYFSYLGDSQADIQIVPGDARVSLERELESDGSQNFDLLVLDTFSGDTMPLHLLTKEAFEIYLGHLEPDGVIAINASNRYFNLPLEIYRLADALNLRTAMIEDKGDGLQSYDSVWMLLTREADFLNQPAIASRSSQRPVIPDRLRAWTDDFSNLLQIVK